jgi:hypothetical protein
MELHYVLRSFSMTYPLQYSVHDWIGNTVWTKEQGYLCPELEYPSEGQVTLYVDYRKDASETLIQSNVELAIDALGYPAGSRWIGRDAKDADTVVSLVALIPVNELEQHVNRIQSVVSSDFLAIFNGKDHQLVRNLLNDSACA